MQLFVHCGSRHLVTVPDDATVDAITEFIETTEGSPSSPSFTDDVLRTLIPMRMFAHLSTSSAG